MTKNNPIDIYIVGTGMVGRRQMTNEAEAAIQESSEVYLAHPHGLFKDYLEQFDVDIFDLEELYQEGENRGNTYQQMAEKVLMAAEESSEPVTMALYGHPTVFVSPSETVVSEGKKRGLNVDLRPGISSMDCIYTDLNLDPARNGIQMFEATDLLIREFDLNEYVPLMIWQIGVVESSLYDPYDSKPERFSRLREYLEQYYPSDHTVFILQTATYPIAESKQIEFELGDFESMHDQINEVQTLYVPPLEEKPVVNEELDELVRTQEHLETITED